MRTQQSLSIYSWAALALALFSFAMSAIISRAVFERLPHLEDELAYLFQARVFASGQIVADLPLPSGPYWQPFIVQHTSDLKPQGGRVGKYPPGWPALLGIGELLGAMWWVNAAFSALTVGLTYRLGREIFGKDVGLIAAILTAFSPMALLLNGTLMSHSSALFFTTLFYYAFWRLRVIQKRSANSVATSVTRSVWRCALVAGMSLGMVTINRPLTGIAIALPFVLMSFLLLGRKLVTATHRFIPTLKPLLVLGAGAVLVTSAIPFFNWAATGDPTKNLYLLVWEYDRVGFGAAGEFGPNGHNLTKGVQFARYDLSLTAADLFGWQVGEPFMPETDAERLEVSDAESCNAYLPMRLQVHLRTCSGYWRGAGLSWVLLLPGLLIGFRRRWAWVWIGAGIAWIFAAEDAIVAQLRDATSNTLALWAVYGVFWGFVPLAFVSPSEDDPRPTWTWLFFGVIASIIVLHFAYWIGSQRYSTRYYFEALTAAAILSAIPLGWLITRLKTRAVPFGTHAVYTLMALVCLWSFFTYSTPRIDALRGYNRVSGAYLDAINARRQTDKPLLVLATGEKPVRWRATGVLMAQTHPDLDGDIVVAWDDTENPDTRQNILDRFPDREVIEIRVSEENAWFPGDCPLGQTPSTTPVPEACTVINP